MTKKTQRSTKPTDQGLEPDPKLFVTPGKTDVNLRTKRTKDTLGPDLFNAPPEDTIEAHFDRMHQIQEMQHQLSKYEKEERAWFLKELLALKNEQGEEKPTLENEALTQCTSLRENQSYIWPASINKKIERAADLSKEISENKTTAKRKGTAQKDGAPTFSLVYKGPKFK